MAGRGNGALPLASGRRALRVSTSSAGSVRALRHCFLREGERNSECSKAFPAVPGRHGEGTERNADGSGRGQGSLPSRSQFARVRPRVAPSPAQRWYGPSCPGMAVGGRGCHVRPVGESSALPCAGSGSPGAVAGPVPAAIPALSSGAALQPALPRLTAGRTGLGFPRVRFRAASGECG